MGVLIITFVLLTSSLNAIRATDNPPPYKQQQGGRSPDHYDDYNDHHYDDHHYDDHHYNDHHNDHRYNDHHQDYRDRRDHYNQEYDASSDYYDEDYEDYLHPHQYHHGDDPYGRRMQRRPDHPGPSDINEPREHIHRGRAYPEHTSSEGGTFTDSDMPRAPQVGQSKVLEQPANVEQQPPMQGAYQTLPKYTKPTSPKLQGYRWVHSWISHFHAILCMVLYAGLIWKIRRERTSVGLSLQSIIALVFSESISFLIRLAEYKRTGYLDASVIYTDLLSTVLAIWCAFSVRSKFNNSREDQLDTFGLNIINWFYVSIFTLPICPNFSQDSGGQDKRDKNKRSVPMSWVQSPDGMPNTLDVNMETLKHNRLHLGQLRPTGLFGSISIRLYGLILYAFIAAPLTIIFLLLKGVIRGFGHHSTVTVYVAAADAVRAVALLPQLYMFEMKQNKRISEQLLLYVTCEACLKILAILYWSTYSLFHYSSTISNLTRVYAICVQLINLLIILRLISALLNPSTRSNAIERSAEMTIPMQESSRDAVPGARNRVAISAASRGPFN